MSFPDIVITKFIYSLYTNFLRDLFFISFITKLQLLSKSILILFPEIKFIFIILVVSLLDNEIIFHILKLRIKVMLNPKVKLKEDIFILKFPSPLHIK